MAEISDDGRGIDLDSVKRRAIDAGDAHARTNSHGYGYGMRL